MSIGFMFLLDAALQKWELSLMCPGFNEPANENNVNVPMLERLRGRPGSCLSDKLHVYIKRNN